MMRDSTSASQWDVLFLDFAKAFDKVPHKELLVKLRKLGVSGDVWLWLESYLSKRTQYVCIEGCCSQLLPVVSGVSQGSILGPLLFLVFVNDLPAVVQHSLMLMFADDTKCGKLVRSPLDSFQLQADLDAMCSWSKEWKLEFKVCKCILMRCCSKVAPVSSTYTLNGLEIEVRSEYKDLGVIVSSNLSFGAHYQHIISRAYRVLGLLRRTFSSNTNLREKKRLYVSLVRSQLVYCSPFSVEGHIPARNCAKAGHQVHIE